jgi:hypothetical protein
LTVKKIKQLPKRQWSTREKCWFIPNDSAVVDLLVQLVGPERIIDKTKNTQETKPSAPEVVSLPQEPAPAPAHIAAMPDLIDRLKKELRGRGYSSRTVTNYRAFAAKYLSWLDHAPLESDVPEIKRYQLHLKENRGLSEHTVNLATAVLLFFYNNVMGYSIPGDSLPRMKTGRQLPKVYAGQDIERMLAVTTNKKHRLVLMLAYGCGLRLNEIRHLKRKPAANGVFTAR